MPDTSLPDNHLTDTPLTDNHLPDAGVPQRKSILFRLLRAISLGYLALMVISCSIQTKLIFPGARSQGTPQAQLVPARNEKLLDLMLTDGTPIKMLWGAARLDPPASRPTSNLSSIPTVIFFYGNADRLANTRSLHAWFTRNGCHALFPEYPGYGLSGGSPGEKQFFDLADQLRHFVTSDEARLLGIDPDNVIIAGQSIGSGTATYYASKFATRKLILLSPFTSLTKTAERVLWFLPVRLLIRHSFDNESRWPSIKAPTLIISGTNDSIVPHDMSITLKQLAPDRVTLVTIQGADHNDLFDYPDLVFGSIQRFLNEER